MASVLEFSDGEVEHPPYLLSGKDRNPPATSTKVESSNAKGMSQFILLLDTNKYTYFFYLRGFSLFGSAGVNQALPQFTMSGNPSRSDQIPHI